MDRCTGWAVVAETIDLLAGRLLPKQSSLAGGLPNACLFRDLDNISKNDLLLTDVADIQGEGRYLAY